MTTSTDKRDKAARVPWWRHGEPQDDPKMIQRRRRGQQIRAEIADDLNDNGGPCECLQGFICQSCREIARVYAPVRCDACGVEPCMTLAGPQCRCDDEYEGAS